MVCGVQSTQLTDRSLARLRSQLERHGIKQVDVARAANVSKHMICHVLAGRAVSAPVVEVIKRLIAEKKSMVAA
jgi:RNA-binding protein YhbY